MQALEEAKTKEFKEYQKQVISNSKKLADGLKRFGLRIVSGGTDTHLSLVDLSSRHLTGRDAADILDRVHITVNKNLIPFDKKSPMLTSGIRLGTSAVTTRGMKEAQMEEIADIINIALTKKSDASTVDLCKNKVGKLVKKFPLYPELTKKR